MRLVVLVIGPAPSAHDKTIIPALKNIQDDKPKEKEEQPLLSLFDSGIVQPFEVGAGNELERAGPGPEAPGS